MGITVGDAVLYVRGDSSKLGGDLDKGKQQAESWVKGVGTTLQNGFSSFLGFMGRDLFLGVTGTLKGIAGEALQSVASYERLSMSIESLVAKEIAAGKVVEQNSQVRIQLSEAEKQKLSELNDTYRLQEIALEKQREAIAKATEKHGENSLAVEEAQIKYRRLEGKLAETGAEIERLAGREGELVTITKKVIEGSMSLGDAMGLAGPKAQELLRWIQALAIQSPFTQEGVATAFRMALAYGFTADEGKRLTTALIDFAAGSGATESSMSTIALALGQIKAKGKLAGQEVLQLVNAGLSVDAILAKAFGKSTEEIVAMREKGLIPADQAIEAITKSLEDDFGGAAKRQSGTFAGLLSSLEDIKSVGLREFFTGTFQAIQPYLDTFVSTLSSPETMAKINAFGNVLGAGVTQLFTKFEWLAGRVGTVISAVQSGMNPFTAFSLLIRGLLPPEMQAGWDWLVAKFTELGNWITTVAVPVFQTQFMPLLTQLGAILLPMLAGTLAQLSAAFSGQLLPDMQAAGGWMAANLLPLLGQLWAWIATNLPPALQTLSNFWLTVLLPAALNFSNWVRDTMGPLFAQLWDWLSVNIPAAIQTASNYWNTVLLPAITAVWAFLNDTVFPFFTALNEFLSAVFGKTVEALAGLWDKTLQPALAKVWGYLNDNIMPIFQGLWTLFQENILPVLQAFGDFLAGDMALRLESWKLGLDGIVTAIQSVTKWLGDMAKKIAELELPDWLTPGSPTPFEYGLIGIARAMEKVNAELPDLSDGLTINAVPVAGAPPQTVTNNTVNFNATYRYQPERELADDTRMLALAR